jgi:hypothetical protein
MSSRRDGSLLNTGITTDTVGSAVSRRSSVPKNRTVRVSNESPTSGSVLNCRNTTCGRPGTVRSFRSIPRVSFITGLVLDIIVPAVEVGLKNYGPVFGRFALTGNVAYA